MDTIESRIARQEYEQRVRLLMPVPDYDARLTDDRQLAVWPIRAGVVSNAADKHGWVSAQIQMLLSAIGSTLNSLSTRLKANQAAASEIQLKDHLNRTA